MNNRALLESAKVVLSEAIEFDRVEERERAYAKYKLALERLFVVYKLEKNANLKRTLARKIQTYMDRAEVLKTEIKNAKKPVEVEESNDVVDDLGKDAEEDLFKKEKPNIKFGDVVGLEAAKETLKETLILPLKYPNLFQGKRMPARGILLYGPPGTGKSFLAKAVATEADSTFFSVSSADLVSKWSGKSEKMVRSLFQMARDQSPAIVFFDEIDCLFGTREVGGNEASRRIKTELLVQIAGIGNSNDGLVVLGATNAPWDLDPPMRRRFQKRIHIDLPDQATRSYMFELNLRNTNHNVSETEFRKLGNKSGGYSGADISAVVKSAINLSVEKPSPERYLEPEGEITHGLYCSREHASQKMASQEFSRMNFKEPIVNFHHMLEALKSVKPSVNSAELAKYKDWAAEFGEDD